MLDEILKRVNLKYEDLTSAERETLNVWVDALQKGELSLPKIKEYVISMREAVQKELAVSKLGPKQDLFLKARMRNYILLEAFLSTPERAKQQMENMLSGIVGKKVS